MWFRSYQITPQRTAYLHTYWPSSSTAITTAVQHTEQKRYHFKGYSSGALMNSELCSHHQHLITDIRVTSAWPRLHTSAGQNQAIMRVYDTPFQAPGCSNTGGLLSQQGKSPSEPKSRPLRSPSHLLAGTSLSSYPCLLSRHPARTLP